MMHIFLNPSLNKVVNASFILSPKSFPELSAEILNSAFCQLGDTEVIIGPAKDGGYYLLGMMKDCTVLFNKNNWGTHLVYENTIALINENRFSYANLIMLNDVDTVADLPEEFIIEKTK